MNEISALNPIDDRTVTAPSTTRYLLPNRLRRFGARPRRAVVPLPAREVVRPARLERATSWFVARRSIQLSYGRASTDLLPRQRPRARPERSTIHRRPLGPPPPRPAVSSWLRTPSWRTTAGRTWPR